MVSEADEEPTKKKKKTTSLVNVSLKFQTLISQICQYFSLINMRSFSDFFNKNYQCIKS